MTGYAANQSRCCELLSFEPPFANAIYANEVHLLSSEAKFACLENRSSPTDTDVTGIELKDRLTSISESIAECYAVRSEALEHAPLRLISTSNDQRQQEEQSFIALTYRWSSPVMLEKSGQYSLPITPEMYAAVKVEVQRDEFGDKPVEGLWIDQICIDQRVEAEKQALIGVMDLLYSSARLVVVVLDGVYLDEAEIQSLLSYGAICDGDGSSINTPCSRQSPAYASTNMHLYTAVEKIVRSPLFSRAWCIQELELSKRNIFLVGATKKERGASCILRFNGTYYKHLLVLYIEVPRSREPYRVRSDFFRAEATGNIIEHMHRLLGQRDLRDYLNSHPTITKFNFPPAFIIQPVGDIFYYSEASGDGLIQDPVVRRLDALKDKLSIVLNIVKNGLVLLRSKLREDTSIDDPDACFEDTCLAHIMIVALASGDPIALCTSGPRLRLSGRNKPSSWLCRPDSRDHGSFAPEPSRIDPNLKFSVDIGPNCEFIDLDLAFPCQPEDRHRASVNDFLTSASQFLSQCLHQDIARDELSILRITDFDSDTAYGLTKELFSNTLACILECGSYWLSKLDARMCGGTNSEAILRALNMISDRVDGRFWFKAQLLENPDVQEAAKKVWGFVAFLITRGLPVAASATSDTSLAEWRPIWFSLPSEDRVLTFAPTEDVELAIPKALLPHAYRELRRCWVVQRKDDSTCLSLQLLGKSRLTGSVNFLENVTSLWPEERARVFQY
ncbi:uncharacterized protein KY384_004955 [Bacidia gigantensis]|uniref:uncharacterized protein n=1 Tax=Bacidia gigantensis TaxID=2732470 RepID=UPI001D03C216|nr:uncharacterized protein KY384_004955 [Bacidia gigantensis]KAG8530453.1 hypothetical protein KY384_004955 [Bacidia gigantensis]